jgi:hypothetical protein
MTAPLRRLGAALVTVAALAGDEHAPAGPDDLAPCSGSVAVSVTAGTTPTFTWTPACAASAMMVEARTSERWFVAAAGPAGIASGVTYGTVPAGASELGKPAATLVAGQTYTVTVFRAAADHHAVTAGHATFTP